MKYEANVPEHFGNSFWTNVKTRWNYNDNSTWIKLNHSEEKGIESFDLMGSTILY